MQLDTSQLPKYSLDFAIIPRQAPSPAELKLMAKSLSPLKPKSNIPSIVLEWLESMASDYVRAIGKTERFTATAVVTFSREQGIQFHSCSDDKIKAIFERKPKECHLISTKEAYQLGIGNLKQIEPTEQQKEEAKKFGKKKVFYMDLQAFKLFEAGVKEPVRIALEVNGLIASETGGGQTTGVLRFPHLYRDLEKHYGTDLLNICIVGPGIQCEFMTSPKTNQQLPILSTPQVAELFALRPNSQFLLLDNDPVILGVLKDILTERIMTYNPFLLVQQMSKSGQNAHAAAPQHYQELFRKMAHTIKTKALLPKKAREALEGKTETDTVLLKIEPEKYAVRQFDILTSIFNPQDQGKFDVVLATMSISVALAKKVSEGSTGDYFGILGKFLSLLKEGGSLYIDSVTLSLFLEIFDEKGMRMGMHYLESLIGNRLSIEIIPLSDFLPQHQGLQGIISNASRQNPEAKVTSSDVTRITRQREKVVMTSEEKEAIRSAYLQLIALQKQINQLRELETIMGKLENPPGTS